MLQLSLNTIPQNLFPLPIVKSHYEIQYLIDMKNEQENEINQDQQRQYKERTPIRKDQLISRQKRSSTVQNEMKFSIRKVSEMPNFSQDKIQTCNTIMYNTIDCSVNNKQLTKQIAQEQQFQIKQNQIQQMIREKLYTSYCNSLKKQSKLKSVLHEKIDKLAPFISKEKNNKKQNDQLLKLRSQSLNFYNDSMVNSIQRITSQQRNPKFQYSQYQTREIISIKQEFKNKDAERIVKKLNKKTQRLLSESHPEIDPQPVVDYQKNILARIELRQSTKKKLQQSFNEIMQYY